MSNAVLSRDVAIFSMTTEWKLYVRWGGQVVGTSVGPDYEGGYAQGLTFGWRFTYEELLSSIHNVIGMKSSSRVYDILYKCPEVYVPYISLWTTLPIKDDQGVQFMLQTYEFIDELQFMELYVFVESSTASTSSLQGGRGGVPYENLEWNIPATEGLSIESSGEETPADTDSDATASDKEAEQYGIVSGGFEVPANMFHNLNLGEMVANNDDISGRHAQVCTWNGPSDLSVGQCFKDKDQLLFAVKEHNWSTHHTYDTKESNKKSLALVCHQRATGCPWKLRACLKKKALFWEITKYVGPHTCYATGTSQDHRHVDMKEIVFRIKEIYRR